VAAERELGSAGKDPTLRLPKARALETALVEGLENERQREALGDEPSADADLYSARLSAVRTEIVALEATLRERRVEEILARLSTIAEQAASLGKELERQKATSPAALEQKKQRITNLEALLSSKIELHEELQALGQTPPAVDLGHHQESLRQLASARQGLESEEQAVLIADLERRLRALHEDAVTLKATLLAGGADSLSELRQREAQVSRYTSSIAERRKLSQRLESSGRAVRDEITLRVSDDEATLPELERRITEERSRFALVAVDEEYAQLETALSKILDAYTLAFDTGNQRTEAKRLLDQYRKMLQNRRNALANGSAAAPEQLRSLEQQIADLQRQNPYLR
jgi:hypothetical protein